MTKKELINWLENKPDDLPIVVKYSHNNHAELQSEALHKFNDFSYDNTLGFKTKSDCILIG